MNNYKFCLIIWVLTMSINLFSQKTSSGSLFSKDIQKNKDTMTIYARKVNCDSVVTYKWKIYKGKEEYKVIDYYEITNKLSKKCLDRPIIQTDKLVFKPRRNYHFSVSQIDTLILIENLIRSSDNKKGKCVNRLKFILSTNSKRYESKRKACGLEILDRFQFLLIGELETDSNNIDQE